MIGLADGFKAGYGLRRQRDQDKADQAWRDQQMAWQREDRAERANQRNRENIAFSELESLQRDGVVDASATGIAQPSAQMLHAGVGGYGKGAAAVQEAAGDYQREMNRFAAAPGSAAGLPAYNGAGEVNARAARESEIARQVANVALARRDMGAFTQANAQAKKFRGDEAMAGATVTDALDPAFLKNLNTNHKFVQIGKDDKGNPTISYVDNQGDSHTRFMTPAMQLTLARAQRLAAEDPERALGMVAQVDANLASAIAADNKFQIDFAKSQSGLGIDAARREYFSDRGDAATARAELTEEQRRRLAAGQTINGSTPRPPAAPRGRSVIEVPPELRPKVAEYNEALAIAQDPSRTKIERFEATGRANRLKAEIDTGMGKLSKPTAGGLPKPDKEPKPADPVTAAQSSFLEKLKAANDAAAKAQQK